MRSMLRVRLAERRVKQVELARTLGVHEITVHRWCTDDGMRTLTIGKAERVAAALGCRVRDLFEED